MIVYADVLQPGDVLLGHMGAVVTKIDRDGSHMLVSLRATDGTESQAWYVSWHTLAIERPGARHYQVTDDGALCNDESTDGTTVERNVTCPACLAALAKINNS